MIAVAGQQNAGIAPGCLIGQTGGERCRSPSGIAGLFEGLILQPSAVGDARVQQKLAMPIEPVSA
ncbi:MAG TPA: hypothetical protein VEM36_04580, partial [Xanthobacteraceae bacterium]|nr:hypothetical protein [Xanthobacteraceae bacterium]